LLIIIVFLLIVMRDESFDPNILIEYLNFNYSLYFDLRSNTSVSETISIIGLIIICLMILVTYQIID